MTQVTRLHLHPLGQRSTAQYTSLSGYLHKDSVKKFLLQFCPFTPSYNPVCCTSVTCIVLMLWYVILCPLPSQTHLATEIFLFKSTTSESLDHFSYSSLNCLQFVSLFLKKWCLEMNEAKTTTSCFTSPIDANRNDYNLLDNRDRKKK